MCCTIFSVCHRWSRIHRLASMSRPCRSASWTWLRLERKRLLLLYVGASCSFWTTRPCRVGFLPTAGCYEGMSSLDVCVTVLRHSEKVQEEIDRVIGQFRQPAMADRANMPYTEAVIHEIQRFANAVPAGFPKMAAKDTTLGEYFIPKVNDLTIPLLMGFGVHSYLGVSKTVFFQGSAITTMLSSVLFDKNEWETPDVFNPNHFLDSEGRFRKRDAFLPFSAGFLHFFFFFFLNTSFANVHPPTLVGDLITAGFLQVSVFALGSTWPRWSCSFSSPPSCSVLNSLLFLDKCPTWRAFWVSPTLLSRSEW